MHRLLIETTVYFFLELARLELLFFFVVEAEQGEWLREDHRNMWSFILEGTSAGLLDQPAHGWANLDRVAQSCVPLRFEYIQGCRMHSLSGHLSRGLITLTVKDFYLVSERNTLCYDFCPFLLFLFIPLWWITQPFLLCAQPLDYLGGPHLNYLLCQYLSCIWGPTTRFFPDMVLQVQNRKITPWSAGHFLWCLVDFGDVSDSPL